MKAHFKGQKVCFLGQSDDFGHGGLTGLKDVGVNPSIQQFYNVNGLVSPGPTYFTPFILAEQAALCKVVFLDTIPGATAAALGNAAAIHYSPHWVISSVGSDPITVSKEAKGAFTDVGATTFAELAASTDSNAWNAWDRKILLADPSFDSEFGFTSPRRLTATCPTASAGASRSSRRCAPLARTSRGRASWRPCSRRPSSRRG